MISKRKLAAEALGTAMILVALVGSGIMGHALSGGIAVLALLVQSLVVGAMIYLVITCLGPISGGHFNPAVTAAFVLRRDMGRREGLGFVLAQMAGAIVGVWLAHLMLGQPILQIYGGNAVRPGMMWLSECVAVFGLLTVIFAGFFAKPAAVPTLVAIYSAILIWFTGSGSLANPAVTLARPFTDSLSGLWIGYLPVLFVAQALAVAGAHYVLRRPW